MYYEVIKESFSCCFNKLILGWDGLGISSVVDFTGQECTKMQSPGLSNVEDVFDEKLQPIREHR
jgi:hypothetical protein